MFKKHKISYLDPPFLNLKARVIILTSLPPDDRPLLIS